MEKKRKKQVVVIGGGSGTYTLLEGLKRHADELTITKIVSMADSGGSTGRLRDQFGHLPVGDARMGLAALATENTAHARLLRELLLYRFEKGDGLTGHNFGNLLLVALTELLGSEAQAIQAAGELFRIEGRVLPVTADSVHLVATYEDGVVVTGEHEIDEPSDATKNKRIIDLTTNSAAKITKETAAAIAAADMVVIGPGDLYTSLLANCVIGGVSAAIQSTSGIFVYIANLMERPGQTRGMSVSAHVREVERYAGRSIDHILVNDAALPEAALEFYSTRGNQPVVDDLDDVRVVRGNFVSTELVPPKSGDTLTRSLIRHDGKKLADAILGLL